MCCVSQCKCGPNVVCVCEVISVYGCVGITRKNKHGKHNASCKSLLHMLNIVNSFDLVSYCHIATILFKKKCIKICAFNACICKSASCISGSYLCMWVSCTV